MGARRSFLRITYSPEITDELPLYISSNCLPVKAGNFEPAGHAFHAVALKLRGISDDDDGDDDNRSSSSDGKGQDYIASSDYFSSKGKKKSSESQQQDHYAVLGLGHLRFLATEDQIRKSYREMALKHHPDKQAALLLAEETVEAKQAKKDEIETHFKAIQEAYEVLIDPIKRRNYDSKDEFDDEVPMDCAPHDFFKIFGPAFMRNGRWSVTQPVPSLGDDATALGEVDGFYNFWYSFKSWREFPHADEYDLEQAESREHKRWMERQNAKLQEKARKIESTRIRTLVDNAYRRDPRILRRKEEEKAEKQRRKEAKYLAKKLQEEEAARAAEEERLRKEEEARVAAEAALSQKKAKEKDKKLLRKEKSRLRSQAESLRSAKLFDVSEDDVEKLCTSLDMEQLKKLCDNLEQEMVGDERAMLLRVALNKGGLETANQGAHVIANGSPDSVAKQGSTGSQVAQESLLSSYEKKERPWGKEEIEMLRKAMQKYPKGTSRRWEVVSDYIGTGRSVEEILKATKTVLLQKPDSSKAFDSFLEKRKPAPVIASPLSTRTEAETLPSKAVEAAAAASSSSTANGQVTVESSSSRNIPQVDSVATPNGTSDGTDQDTWSEMQELALVQALKTFPKDAAQRWERVAAAVPGKTVVQCKKKFVLMKENFRSKKSAE